MKKIISWTSFVVILFAIGTFAFLCGVYAANFFVDFFNLKSFWCLLGIIPLFVVSMSVTVFFVLGLKKFGEE